MVVMEVMRVVENGDHEPQSVLEIAAPLQATEGAGRIGHKEH